LRQVDLARADFAAIEDHLDFIMSQLARTPTRMEIARTALMIMFGTAGLVIGWIEVLLGGTAREPTTCRLVGTARGGVQIAQM
jgi:hypothetical protein